MKADNAQRQQPRLAPGDDAARKRAAVETYARHEAVLRRTARRFSLCADDAEDALQRALEILLRKAPTVDPRELIKWTRTVVKHEALAVRRERERILAGPAAYALEPGEEDWVALLPSESDGPPERVERREAVARSREALQALKPQELRALTLLAEGYTYAEIGEITGFSRTKINRCLAEGRERFRRLIAGSEDGSRCAAMKPLLSAFCDGEAREEELAPLREHLRACAHCRATLRAYRAAPGAAAALAPALPLDRSLLERVQDGLGELAARFGGGGSGAAVPQVAGGGAGGLGAAGLAKIAAVCVATAGTACVATGVLPAPAGLGSGSEPAPRIEPAPSDAPAPAPEVAAPPVDPAPRPVPERDQPEPEPERRAKPEPAPSPSPEEAEPVAEPAPVVTAEPIEPAPPPPAPEPVAEPAPEPAPAPSTGGGSPAGEFGP